MSRQGRKSRNSSEIRNFVQAWPKLNLPGWDADTAIALQEATNRFQRKDS